MRLFLFVWAVCLWAGMAFAGERDCDARPHDDASLYNKVEYPLPSVPDSLRLPRDRADFVTLHFWDAYRADAAFAADTACMEQAVANFAAIARMGSGNAGTAEAVAALTRAAALDAGAAGLLAGCVERCLNEEESPVYDPQLYAVFAHAFAITDNLPNWLKVKYETIDRLNALNAAGTKAGDFEMTLRDGTGTSLRKEIGRKFTVLILYDPECEHCKAIMRRFAAEPMVGKWIEAGMVKVLAVDIRQSAASAAKAASLPAAWVVGADVTGIEDEEIYYVQSTPAFYLIDASGTVMLKDADATDVLEAIWMSRD